MLTEHRVQFRFSEDRDQIREDLLSPLAPLVRFPDLRQKVEDVSANRPLPPGDAELQMVLAGIGSIAQQVPMLCFTEIVGLGRDLHPHFAVFGRYGIVLTQDWVLRNGGDRVVYIGDGRELGARLARLMGGLRLFSMFEGPQGQRLFHNEAMRLCVDFVSFVEVSHHFEEFEWRIVGRHGLMGGGSDAGKRLPFTLNDVTAVYVSSAQDVEPVEAALAAKAKRDGFEGPLLRAQMIDSASS
ncbi:MAG TPA: hypothetical protein V6C81_28245 [Planktothrix sp.]|jgi:hypothetical protein